MVNEEPRKNSLEENRIPPDKKTPTVRDKIRRRKKREDCPSSRKRGRKKRKKK